jgi:hypothetical protein
VALLYDPKKHNIILFLCQRDKRNNDLEKYENLTNYWSNLSEEYCSTFMALILTNGDVLLANT